MGYLLCGSSVVPEVVGDSPGAIHQHDTACHHVIIIIIIIIIDHLRSGVVYNFGPFCLSVRQTITFESLDVGSPYLHIRYISRQ